MTNINENIINKISYSIPHKLDFHIVFINNKWHCWGCSILLRVIYRLPSSYHMLLRRKYPIFSGCTLWHQLFGHARWSIDLSFHSCFEWKLLNSAKATFFMYFKEPLSIFSRFISTWILSVFISNFTSLFKIVFSKIHDIYWYICALKSKLIFLSLIMVTIFVLFGEYKIFETNDPLFCLFFIFYEEICRWTSIWWFQNRII